MSDRLHALTVTEIKAALAADGIKFTDDQVLAFQEFLAKVQGVENAKQAVAMLDRVQKVAA